MPSPPGYSNHAIHLVRTVRQINLALSQMAGAGASILMEATFLAFTVAVGQARSGALPWSTRCGSPDAPPHLDRRVYFASLIRQSLRSASHCEA